jgi:hypothetical protein
MIQETKGKLKEEEERLKILTQENYQYKDSLVRVWGQLQQVTTEFKGYGQG